MKLKDLSKPIRRISTKLSLSRTAGQPPGSLIYTGTAPEKPVKLDLVQYNTQQYSSDTYTGMGSLAKKIDEKVVNWIHINNLANITFIEEIGNYFQIHPLTLEDVLNTGHLPKIEESDDQLFLTLKYIRFTDQGELLESHVSLILGKSFLISFADTDEEIFGVLKSRLESVKNRARLKKADYLFYLILDSLVDNYYIVFDAIYNRLEELENQLIENPRDNKIGSIHHTKKDLVSLRKTLVSLEKAVNMILKDEFDLIDDSNNIFVRDVYDHIVQLSQAYDSYREFASSLIELNSSNMNHNMNQTMKILTTIATIFIPLTLIAGIYGMNFKYIPELKWDYGYFFALGLIIVVGLIMVIFMKKKGFL